MIYEAKERIAFLHGFEPSGDVGRDMEDFLADMRAHEVLASRQEDGRSLRTLGLHLSARSEVEALRLARDPIHQSRRYAGWSADPMLAVSDAPGSASPGLTPDPR